MTAHTWPAPDVRDLQVIIPPDSPWIQSALDQHWHRGGPSPAAQAYIRTYYSRPDGTQPRRHDGEVVW